MGNEQEIASEVVDDIMESVCNADAEAFINLFSEQTREKISNLDEGFNQLIECFGSIESYEKISISTHESINYGDKIEELGIAFEVKNSTDVFVCMAYDVIKDTSDSTRIGLYRIRVYSEESLDSGGSKEELLSVGEKKLPIEVYDESKYDLSRYVTSNE